MSRATTLAAFLSACLALGNGFVFVAPRVIPPEPSRPKQIAEQDPFSSSFEAVPTEVGGPETAGVLFLDGGGGEEEKKTRLPEVRSAEDNAMCCQGGCHDLQATGGLKVSLLRILLLYCTSMYVPVPRNALISMRKRRRRRSKLFCLFFVFSYLFLVFSLVVIFNHHFHFPA